MNETTGHASPNQTLPARFYKMDPLYRAGWILLRGLFRLWFRFEVHGATAVPRTGGTLITANHASYLDPPLLGAALHRPVAYMARKSLFQFAPFAWLIRRLNAVAIDREGATPAGIKTAIELLNAGVAVVVFPEGTRSPNGKLQPGKPGVGMIVLRTAAPVVPTRITGSFDAMPRGTIFPRPRKITIKFGPTMMFDELRARATGASPAEFKQLCQQVSDQIMAAIARL